MRAADLDDDGKLVKTPAWDEMTQLMATPLPYDASSMTSYLMMAWQKKIDNQQPLASKQFVKLAPLWPDASSTE